MVPHSLRGLLVFNPNASSTTQRTLQVLTAALGEELKLDVVGTTHRGHATEVAAMARDDGIDVVVALGGDGTANEVTNGLLARGIGDDVPALAVVPGGCTNVFARTLGLTLGAVEGTGQILEALRDGRRQRIGLGRADERWFLFAAGVGLDAEVVAKVERARDNGRRATGPLYARIAARHWLLGGAERRTAPMLLEVPGESAEPVFVTLVTNTDPWTYLLGRAVRPTPDSSYTDGLDVFALRRIATLPTLRTLASILDGRGRPRGRQVVLHHDVPEFSITSSDGTPRDLQVDGDHLGRRQRVTFTSVPGALDIVV